MAYELTSEMLTRVLRIGHENEGLPMAGITVHGLTLTKDDLAMIVARATLRTMVAAWGFHSAPTATEK